MFNGQSGKTVETIRMQVWPKLRLGTAALRPLKIDSFFGPKLASFIHLVNTRHKSQKSMLQVYGKTAFSCDNSPRTWCR